MQNLRLVSVGWFLVGAVVAACSSATAGGGGDDAGGGSLDGSVGGDAQSSAALATCAKVAEASCARIEKCTPWELPYGNLKLCQDAEVASCFRASIRKDTRIASAECAAAIQAQACGAPLPEACQGTRANGAECSSYAQCSSGRCGGVSAGICGTCAKPTSSEGDACSGPDGCYGDFYCDRSNAACVAYAQKGQPCLGRRCGTDLTCSDDDFCVAAPGEGEACTVDCKSGLVCSESRRCEKQKREESSQKPAGGACERDTDCVQGYSCVSQVCTLETPTPPPCN